ncbi:hypothetical protein DL767_003251 [Monosporascus sp. MG133]|nr:hypothetical protein DL767_003251 [Monosporascus sp. MG133]
MVSSAQLRTFSTINAISQDRTVCGATDGYEVDRTYLRRRIEGIPTREEVNENRQKLSKLQEASLVDWIITQVHLGYAPPDHRFRFYARRIAYHNGDDIPFGKNWHQGFFRRNPAVRTIKSQIIDYQHVNGATPEFINLLFVRLTLENIKNIPARYRYNADEIGLVEGMGENGFVI